MDESWLVCSPSQGSPRLHRFLRKPGPWMGGLGWWRSQWALDEKLAFTIELPNTGNFHFPEFGNATKRIWKPALPVRFLDQKKLFRWYSDTYIAGNLCEANGHFKPTDCSDLNSRNKLIVFKPKTLVKMK